MVEDPPADAGDTGSIHLWSRKTPRATGQLNPCTTTREKPPLPATGESPHTAKKNPAHSKIKKY